MESEVARMWMNKIIISEDNKTQLLRDILCELRKLNKKDEDEDFTIDGVEIGSTTDFIRIKFKDIWYLERFKNEVYVYYDNSDKQRRFVFGVNNMTTFLEWFEKQKQKAGGK
jgi:hypothetical protein